MAETPTGTLLELLREKARQCQWDEPEDSLEYFESRLNTNRCDEAWQQLVYYWHAEEQGPDWWSEMVSIAGLLKDEKKVNYAQMRLRLVIERESCVWTLRLGPHIKPYWCQPQANGAYLVWMENEFHAGWSSKTFILESCRSDHPWRKGLWGMGSWDAPILYWRNFPEPPKGHQVFSARGAMCADDNPRCFWANWDL